MKRNGTCEIEKLWKVCLAYCGGNIYLASRAFRAVKKELERINLKGVRFFSVEELKGFQEYYLREGQGNKAVDERHSTDSYVTMCLFNGFEISKTEFLKVFLWSVYSFIQFENRFGKNALESAEAERIINSEEFKGYFESKVAFVETDLASRCLPKGERKRAERHKGEIWKAARHWEGLLKKICVLKEV